MRAERVVTSDPHFVVEYAPVDSPDVGTARARSLARRVTEEFVRYVLLHPQLADEAQFVVQAGWSTPRAGRHRRRSPRDGGRREAGAARDREHAAASAGPAREPRRGERRARHRAGDRSEGAAAHRRGSAATPAAREDACAARRDRRGRRRGRRGSRRLRSARRGGGALAGSSPAGDPGAQQAEAGAADESGDRRHPGLPRHPARSALGRPRACRG